MRYLSLRWLLFVAAFVTLTGVISLLGITVLHTAQHQLSHYAAQRDSRIAHRVAHELVGGFRRGGMSGLVRQADSSASQWGSGLVIRNGSGRVIATAHPPGIRSSVGASPAVTVPLRMGGMPIGTVALVHPPTFEPRLSPVLRAIERRLALAAAVGLTIALAVSIWVGRVAAAPFRKMALAARAVAAGRRDIQLPLVGLQEARALAEDFNHMAQALAASEQQRQRLVADMAHEFRTPLSILLGYVTALDEGVTVPGQDPVALIRDETRHLVRLTDDLQMLARADAQELELSLQWVEIRPWLRNAINALTDLAAQHRIELTLVLKDGLAHAARYDPDRLRQALGNYLHNALKYTPAGGRVTVTAQSDAGTLTLSVADTGIGVDAEDLPRLFDRLYRADRARSRGTGGLGVGLAITKKLVELSGGSVGVQSTKGEGSTFWLQIPLDGPPAS